MLERTTAEDTDNVNSEDDVQQSQAVRDAAVGGESLEPGDTLRSASAIIEMPPWRDGNAHNTSNQQQTSTVETEQDKADDLEGPSNECLLGTAFVSFMGFAILETVAAFAAGSEALMGDSAAMVVDALTYLFNLLAERKKKRFASEHVLPLTVSIYPERARRIFRRDQRKMTLQLELVPPLISATVLMIVTGVVLHEAIRVLILDAHRERSEQSDPNLDLMLGFSVLNLLLDVLNVFCFAKAKHLFGYETIERNNPHEASGKKITPFVHQNRSFGDRARSRNNVDYQQVDNSEGSEDDFAEEQFHSMASGHTHQPELSRQDDEQEGQWECEPNGSSLRVGEDVNDLSKRSGMLGQSDHRRTDDRPSSLTAVNGDDSHEPRNDSELLTQPDGEDDVSDERGNTNLNMCSAYTHVFADTLRSLAVIAAASVAEFFDEVTSEEADAMAAVLVSILILLSLIPLFQGWLQSYKELRAILAEEKSEAMF